MTVEIDCKECGERVPFLFKGEIEHPTAECECGAVYELHVERVDI